jgi:hypothetical protein
VPGEQPDQHRDQHPEVHGGVVEVRDLGQQRVREQEALDVELAWQPQRPLGVPDLPSVRDRRGEPSRREVPGQLPQRVQPDHNARLAQERADVNPPSQPRGSTAGVVERDACRTATKGQ